MAKFQSVGPLYNHIFDHVLGAFQGLCIPWCWEGSCWESNKDSIDRPLQCVVTRPGLESSKSLWTIPVLLASWSRKIFPLVASSHIQIYIITIIDLIWKYISTFYHRLSHTFCNIINNPLKQATQKIIQLAVINKVTSKN